MATIRPPRDGEYTFGDALLFLEVLALNTNVDADPFGITPDGFTAVFVDPRIDLAFEVRGRGFKYDAIRQFQLADGVVEEVDVVFEGAPVMFLSDLDLEVETLAQASRRVIEDGEITAVAELLSALDYDYRGTGADEVDLAVLDDGFGEPWDFAGDDVFDLGDGRHAFSSGSGDDVLIGGPFADVLEGGPGDDVIEGGRGGDTLRGGSGVDTAELAGLLGGGFALLRSDLRAGDTVYAIDRGDVTFDGISRVERFTDGVQTVGLADLPVFEPWAYAASHPDVVDEVGTEGRALLTHFLFEGAFEGREVTFEAGQYLANYADLRAAFGDDGEAAARHHVLHGHEEGRLAADPLDYLASFADLSAAFGDLPVEAMRAAGLRHFKRNGVDEGRGDGIDFDAEAYLANHVDLRAAFGEDGDAAAMHYARWGRDEGRLVEDGLAYLASHDDLVLAVDRLGLSTEAELRGFATRHFRLHGEREGRDERIDFDVSEYLGNYCDLRAAFADGEGGYDEEAATLHWILTGSEAGRSDDLLSG